MKNNMWKNIMTQKVSFGAIFIGFTLLVLAPAEAYQGEGGFAKCGQISSNSERLACFDAALAAVNKPSARSKSVTPMDKVDDFGKSQLKGSPVKAVAEQQQKAESEALDAIKMKVVDYAYTSSKKFVLFMENGQIWKQKSGNRIRLPKGHFEVEIKKGMISGFNAIVPTHKLIIKVKRLK